MTQCPQLLSRAGASIALALLLSACGGTDVIRPSVPDSGGGAGDSGGGAGEGVTVNGSGWTVRQAGPRELVVSFVGAPAGDGPCESRLRAVAAETPNEVRLSVVDDRPPQAPADGEPQACPAIGYQWALPVTLAADLGSRVLLAADGRRLEATVALAPTYLPEGYVLSSESGGDGHHFLTYGSSDGGWLIVHTGDGADADSVERAVPQVGERTVEGRTFRLLESELQKVVTFERDGRRVWVSWQPQRVDSPAAMGWEELLAVAGSVG